MRILICIPTYRRPQLLCECLHSLAALESPPNAEISLLVADNDAEESAREFFSSHRRQLPFDSHYAVEPQRGRPFARNLCLNHAAEEKETSHLLFVDDDMTLSLDYLRLLLRDMESLKADAARGHQQTVYLKNAPPRKKRSCRRSRTLSTSGVLISAKIFREWNLRFDPRFLRGEDADFFYRAYLRGARLFQTETAVFFEPARDAAPMRISLLSQFRANVGFTEDYFFIVRLRGGIAHALLLFSRRGIVLIFRIFLHLALVPFQLLKNDSERRGARFEHAIGEFGRLVGAIRGLFISKPGYFKDEEVTRKVWGDK